MARLTGPFLCTMRCQLCRKQVCHKYCILRMVWIKEECVLILSLILLSQIPRLISQWHHDPPGKTRGIHVNSASFLFRIRGDLAEFTWFVWWGIVANPGNTTTVKKHISNISERLVFSLKFTLPTLWLFLWKSTMLAGNWNQRKSNVRKP